MREITPENAAEYLRESGRVAPGREVVASALGWGVSNVVLRVEVEGEPPFVLKQARGRLRTEKLWVSRLERVWTERDAMGLLGTILPEGTVPRVLFSDEPNYLFAMTHAPEEAVVWKEQLLAGLVDPEIARRAGTILGTVHRATVNHPALNGRLADTTVFDELRVDPFYREIARVHPEIAPRVEGLIASMDAHRPRCLVLGDFSPKNILVHDRGLTLVDFETAHAGDPAFDLGFFLSHLLLKALRAQGQGPGGRDGWGPTGAFGLVNEFLDAYELAAGPGSVARGPGRPGVGGLAHALAPGPASTHLNACLLARVDGKSPVDYLDEPLRRAVRAGALARLASAGGGTESAAVV
jgi:5-methylthioribose kinase